MQLPPLVCHGVCVYYVKHLPHEPQTSNPGRPTTLYLHKQTSLQCGIMGTREQYLLAYELSGHGILHAAIKLFK